MFFSRFIPMCIIAIIILGQEMESFVVCVASSSVRTFDSFTVQSSADCSSLQCSAGHRRSSWCSVECDQSIFFLSQLPLVISSLKRSLSNNKQSRGMRIDVSAGRSFRCCAKVQEAQVMDCPAIMYYIVHTTIISSRA